MKKQIHLLIVEDSPDDAELLALELEKNGIQLHYEVVQNKEALRKALAAKSWDMVISDYAMPGFTGLEALRLVRQKDLILPFVLVSGTVGEEVAVQLMREGAQDYILKHNLVKLSSTVVRAVEEAKIKQQAIVDANLLKRSNERLRLIYNSSKEMMFLWRVENGKLFFEFMNETAYELIASVVGKVDQQSLVNQSYEYFLTYIIQLNATQVRAMVDRYEAVVRNKSVVKHTDKYELRGYTFYVETWMNPVIEDGRCTHLLGISRDVTESFLAAEQLKETLQEVERLKTLLEQENKYLKEEIKLDHNFEDIVFASHQMKRILEQVEQVAPVDATALILGETGTGKELIARSIHHLSARKDKPLVKVNCAALNRDLIESELFGHEKGAFTGANQRKIGRFELAHNGTILLDEVGEIPIELQAKLLRVLQEGEFERLGSSQTIKVDVRVIAATNRDLTQAMKDGNFREDLFYRLNVFPITIPPLRERKEDIAPLVSFFVNKYARKFNKHIKQIPASAIALLKTYHWPGNIRELENMVERALILSKKNHLPFAQILGLPTSNEDIEQETDTSLRQIERLHILNILNNCNWKINGPAGAAERLDLAPSTLRDKMKKLGLSRPK